jgi:hypothetical protein
MEMTDESPAEKAEKVKRARKLMMETVAEVEAYAALAGNVAGLCQRAVNAADGDGHEFGRDLAIAAAAAGALKRPADWLGRNIDAIADACENADVAFPLFALRRGVGLCEVAAASLCVEAETAYRLWCRNRGDGNAASRMEIVGVFADLTDHAAEQLRKLPAIVWRQVPDAPRP